MTPRRGGAALALLLVASCGERVPTDRQPSPAPDLRRATPTSDTIAEPVRIGEAGMAFNACQATGTTRGGDPAADALPVRTAPFESALTRGRIAAATRFFVCTRSIDQRWMGVVYADDGTLPPACGVSAPARRGNYAGPCRSGWVASASVRLVAS